MRELNISNFLTVFRLLAAPAVFILIIASKEFPNLEYCALILFVLAALSDVLDGYLARKRKTITKFGKITDPIADKLLFGFALFGILIKNKAIIWSYWIWLSSLGLILYAIGYLFFVKKKVKISQVGRMISALDVVIIILMIAGFINNYILVVLTIILIIPNIIYIPKTVKRK